MTQEFGYERKQIRNKGERNYFYLRVRLNDWKRIEIEGQKPPSLRALTSC
jgi:hypothetical protein